MFFSSLSFRRINALECIKFIMKLEDNRKCFVCGEKNPNGLHLDFKLEDDILKTNFNANERYQGYKGILHGGVIKNVPRKPRCLRRG